ncbi:MAG: hypothetical protein ACXWJZ_12600 [Burkholderiaceae bacterium]
MLVFLDTEFTDFNGGELISIGMAADDKRLFYGERNDFDQSRCSDFVKTIVLPHLGKRPRRIYDKAGLSKAVREWLGNFKETKAVICFDFDGDWALFVDLLNHDIPDWVEARNVYLQIDDLKKEHFMHTLFDGADHHALHDAICNKLAYRRDYKP